MKFMRYIGGQDHILCHKHHLPLITSAEKEKKCNCGRKECLTCPEINCKICICNKCANAIPDNEERLIYPPSIPEVIEINEEVLEDSDNIEESTRSSNDTSDQFDPSELICHWILEAQGSHLDIINVQNSFSQVVENTFDVK